jgi:hypothetical protein
MSKQLRVLRVESGVIGAFKLVAFSFSTCKLRMRQVEPQASEHSK